MRKIHLFIPIFLLSLSGIALVGAQTFTNITTASGIGGGGGSWPSGASLVDLDGDGDLDFYQSSHSDQASIRLNNGSGTFTAAGGSFPSSEMHNGYDLNEDGKVDMMATVFDGSCRLWINNSTPGNVNFTAGNPNIATRQEAFVDINKDGKVDWLSDGGDGIDFNYGNGTGGLTVGSKILRIDSVNSRPDGMAPMPCDLDGDGDMDLVVAWGRYEFEMGRSAILRNDGAGNFTNITVAAGLYQDSLAILGVGDYDQDGDLDLIALEKRRFPHSIFLNDGTGHFTKKTGAVTGSTGSPTYPGWGLASFTDFDNDGIGDIIVGGRSYTHVLRGTGNGNFEVKNAAWGISTSGDGNLDNTYSFGDIDADGDLDLAIHPAARVSILYRNNLPAKNWLNVRPVGLAGNKGAAGAIIRIFAAGTSTRLWWEQVLIHSKQAQQNYYCFAQTERHYGLDTRATCDVQVQFYPSGKIVCQSGVSANTTVTINESSAACIVGIQDGHPPMPGFGGQAGISLEASPNPFNPAVIISFNARAIHESPIHLSIYNAAGKCVSILASGNLAPGAHSITWNAASQPSGLYVARLQTGGKLLTKQILLLK